MLCVSCASPLPAVLASPPKQGADHNRSAVTILSPENRRSSLLLFYEGRWDTGWSHSWVCVAWVLMTVTWDTPSDSPNCLNKPIRIIRARKKQVLVLSNEQELCKQWAQGIISWEMNMKPMNTLLLKHNPVFNTIKPINTIWTLF